MNTSEGVSVIGGEGYPLPNGILSGTPGILYGSGTDLSTAFYPTATVTAWEDFIATAIPGASEAVSTAGEADQRQA